MAEQRPRYSYDMRAQRYRSAESGQFVSPDRVARAVDAVAAGAKQEARTLAQRVLDGQSSLQEFQAALESLIKAEHVAAAIAGRGGAAMMSPSDYLWTARRIKEQYAFARNFVQEIAQGTQPLNGTLLSRAELYGDAMATTHREMERRVGILAGANQERNRLGPADHSPGCLEETSKGWVTAGSLVPVGGRDCKARCKCRIETRVSAEAA